MPSRFPMTPRLFTLNKVPISIAMFLLLDFTDVNAQLNYRDTMDPHKFIPKNVKCHKNVAWLLPMAWKTFILKHLKFDTIRYIVPCDIPPGLAFIKIQIPVIPVTRHLASLLSKLQAKLQRYCKDCNTMMDSSDLLYEGNLRCLWHVISNLLEYHMISWIQI